MTGLPGETIVATAADVASGLAWLVKERHLPEPEALRIKLEYEMRDADREETGSFQTPDFMGEP